MQEEHNRALKAVEERTSSADVLARVMSTV